MSVICKQPADLLHLQFEIIVTYVVHREQVEYWIERDGCAVKVWVLSGEMRDKKAAMRAAHQIDALFVEGSLLERRFDRMLKKYL